MTKSHILPTIVISQFCCTSLWFASNGVMSDLVDTFSLSQQATGNLTSAVQFGFIAGTFLFALLTVADRFPPSRVFFICALLGGGSNLALILPDNTAFTLLLLRVATGFFLAGIYPVGMKIAADYFDKGLGSSLGFLVGALVVGTSFPHLISSMENTGWQWQTVIQITSGVAATGGLAMWLIVPNGPFRKKSQKINIRAIRIVFKNRQFKAAAFGYFGHMWELYTFWAFVPLMLEAYKTYHSDGDFSTSLWSFLIIGLGGLACVLAGQFSLQHGAKKIATWALTLSGLCCLIFPFAFLFGNTHIFLGFLVVWGLVVIADSPLFSTLVAQNAEAEIKGTALTIVNSIGFAITIFSIQLMSFLFSWLMHPAVFMVLALGPVFGLFHLKPKASLYA
jgi:MFS family permease